MLIDRTFLGLLFGIKDFISQICVMKETLDFFIVKV